MKGRALDTNASLKFVDEVGEMEGDFVLIAGGDVIDAKSIMGIYSLDLSKPLQLKITNADKRDVEKLRKYCV